MKLLLIGTDRDVLERATTILRDEGYSVDVAETVSLGRFRWLTQDYDLILLDISSEISETWIDDSELRKRHGDTPVLMFKSHDSDLNKMRSDANEVISKPFTRSELVGRIRARLPQPVRMDEHAITLGSVVIDTRRQTVTVDQTKVALTRKEYCLLELLAMHRGTLVSRTEIYDHLFDVSDPSLSNLLDVYVSKIRRKLGRRFITTRRGVGYVIEG